MHYFFSLVFAVMGIACFIWYKPLYRTYAQFIAKGYRDQFGNLAKKMRWDDPEGGGQIIIYKGGIIALGIFFLAMALHFAFGPISIGDSEQTAVPTSTAAKGQSFQR
jgi:hypothetical protein